MQIEHLKIKKVGRVSCIEINGEEIERVLDYKVSLHAHDASTLDMTFDISGVTTEIEAVIAEGQKEEKVTKFDILGGMTDIKKFSELMFDLVSHTGTSEDLAKLLAEGMTDEGLQNLESIAQSGYPLFLNGKEL